MQQPPQSATRSVGALSRLVVGAKSATLFAEPGQRLHEWALLGGLPGYARAAGIEHRYAARA